MKKRLPIILGLTLIVLLTAGLLFFPFGKEDAGDSPDIQRNITEISRPVGEKNSETGQELPHATEETVPGGAVSTSEIPTEVQTETETEEVTEALVSGSGPHNGSLGSSYTIPDGFYDKSPKSHEEGYYYIYENPERDMLLQVAEFHLENQRVGFDGEYTVLHNMYRNDPGSYVIRDEKENLHYLISGYTQDESRVFYIEGYKYPDRNEVQIYSEYPNDEWKDTCDEYLDQLLNSYQYFFVSNPDQKQTEEEENSLYETE